MTSLIEAICRRRSVSPKYLEAPGPTPQQLGEMARAAAAGIDHGRLAPTRFVWIKDETRHALADAFAAASIEADGSGDEGRLQIARERALAGPCLVAVVARIDAANAIPPHEQWIAVGAALHNFMLAASSMDYAAKVVSGKRVDSDALRGFFRLDAGEHLVGFIAMGTATQAPRDLPRKSPEEILVSM